jgi:nitric oxide reductase large subunit
MELKVRREGPSTRFEWTSLILGAGLACAAFGFAELPVAAWNAGIVGVMVGCCSVALYRYGDWAQWSNLTLGCWAVTAPFLLGFGSVQTLMWMHVLTGLCVATSAIVQLLARRRTQTTRTEEP